MKAQRAKRFAAASAIGVLLAGGATIATAGTASAAPTQVRTGGGCYMGGWNCGGGGGSFYGGYGFNYFPYFPYYNSSPSVVVIVV